MLVTDNEVVLKNLMSLGFSIASEFSSNKGKNDKNISNAIRMANLCVAIKSKSKNEEFENYCQTIEIPKEYCQKEIATNENNSTDSNGNLVINVKTHPKYNEKNLTQSLIDIIDSCQLSLPPELSVILFVLCYYRCSFFCF